LDQELCTCRRPVSIRHCPNCGSTNAYARHSSSVILENPLSPSERIVLRGFMCRRCGTTYHEGEECKAPKATKPTDTGTRVSPDIPLDRQMGPLIARASDVGRRRILGYLNKYPSNFTVKAVHVNEHGVVTIDESIHEKALP